MKFRQFLKSAGYEVSVNKINITTPDLATKYAFLSSPTIRINGNDISLEVTGNFLQGLRRYFAEILLDCRSWVYEGVEHPEPPKEMIVNAIMNEVYGGRPTITIRNQNMLCRKILKYFSMELKQKRISNDLEGKWWK